jgi:putative peptidoglycan lipid II flippase
MSQMLKSSGATAAATMASRVLGLVREMAYAAFMSKGWVADAFMMAFQIPNLFRRLLGEGALTAAFIPLFKEKEKNEGHEAMWRSANAVISGLLVVASALVIVGIGVTTGLLAFAEMDKVNAPLLSRLHHSLHSGKMILMLKLLRVMLPYLLLVCVAAVFMGMLNARGHFFVPALGSVFLNLAMIASVKWVAPHMGVALPEQVFGLALGVLAAGFVQAFFQMPLLRKEGFRFRWVTPWHDETVRIVVKRMLPTTIGVAAFQINVLVASGFALVVGDGIVSSFNYAVRLMELPQGVFGVSLAMYLLPALSGLAAEKKYPEFRATLRDGIGYLLFINGLATVLLLTLAEPMVRLLFQRRSFRPEDTPDVAIAVQAVALGLVAFSLINILGRAFYALGDTKTPMKISVCCLVLNAIITLPLIWMWQQAGMGLANTATGVLNVALLFFALRKKLKTLELAAVRANVLAIIGAAVAAGLAAWAARMAWTRSFGHETLWLRMGEVFVPMLAATLVYFGIAFAMKIPYAHDIIAVIRRRARQSN